MDAAAWAGSDRRAQAVLAAGVQQRLVRPGDLLAAAAGNQRRPRRAMIKATVGDIAGGAQALSELDLARLVRRHRPPEPDRQAPRRDATLLMPSQGKPLSHADSLPIVAAAHAG